MCNFCEFECEFVRACLSSARFRVLLMKKNKMRNEEVKRKGMGMSERASESETERE